MRKIDSESSTYQTQLSSLFKWAIAKREFGQSTYLLLCSIADLNFRTKASHFLERPTLG